MIAIVDPATSPAPYPSPGAIQDKAFRAFVDDTLKAVGEAVRLPNRYATTAGPHDAPTALTFLRLPLVTSGDKALPHPAVATQGAHCSIRTPWFDLAVTRGATPSISGAFHWNERQILRDRAHIAGPASDASPLSQSAFEGFAAEYSASMGGGTAPAQSSIPADILWLFKNSPQNSRGLFSDVARGTMHRIAEESAQYYGRLASVLIKRCLENNEKELNLSTIDDATRTVPFFPKE